MENLNEPEPTTSDKISLRTVLILIIVIVAISGTSLMTGIHIGNGNHEELVEKFNDNFKDLGNHSLHEGDLYIVKEFLSVDGTLHVEFELKKELELSFEMLDSAGYTVWKSPYMKDAPGHHEIKWDPIHRDGGDLPIGNYTLAVQIDDDRAIIGEFLHNFAEGDSTETPK